MAVESNEDRARIVADIRSIVQDVRDLPTLPTIAIEVRRLVDDPSTNISDMVGVVDRDVALTGRILRIANSAYYGIPRKVDNLKMAMVILGVREMVNLVTSVSVLRMIQDQTVNKGFDIREFWIHSATCAELAVSLYKGLRLTMPTSAYIAGLLHDIGKLILNQQFPEYHEACLNYAAEHKVRIVSAEINVLGVDHGHIGGWLTKRWNIPEEITEAISRHHIRPSDSPKNGLPTIIDWADRLFYVMKSRDRAETIDVLNSNEHWREWLGDNFAATEKIVGVLFEGWERSHEMIKLLD